MPKQTTAKMCKLAKNRQYLAGGMGHFVFFFGWGGCFGVLSDYEQN